MTIRCSALFKDVLEHYDGEISLFSNLGLVRPKALIRSSRPTKSIGEARATNQGS